MTNDSPTEAMTETLLNMLSYLDHDPDNLQLLSDCAEMALNEGHPKKASELLNHFASISELPAKDIGNAGLAALQCKNYKDAEIHFRKLYTGGEKSPTIRFNLAWSLAMNKENQAALDVMDSKTLETLPQAAMLELQILHETGQLKQAEERAKKHVESEIKHSGLNAAISVLALDIEDAALAKSAALKAGAHPDALTTLGTLALDEDDPDEALKLFNSAMDISQGGPRTLIGKGLAQLLKGENDEALKNIDQGAEIFETHIGSWIAAGWAHFMKQDFTGARKRFDRALSIDENFAESHGSLAVIDVIEGQLSQARIRTKIALKLDRECFSASLARALMVSSNGNPDKAEQILHHAINTPIDESGRTISRSITRLGLSSPTLH